MCNCVIIFAEVLLIVPVCRIVKDMDEATNKLMGAHGYCTQVGITMTYMYMKHTENCEMFMSQKLRK